jgi:hypothetical protein
MLRDTLVRGLAHKSAGRLDKESKHAIIDYVAQWVISFFQVIHC